VPPRSEPRRARGDRDLWKLEAQHGTPVSARGTREEGVGGRGACALDVCVGGDGGGGGGSVK
jgi:hypothetical protein